MITDRATFAYLADVFVLAPHRGKGLSKRLMTFIQAHPDLQGLDGEVIVGDPTVQGTFNATVSACKRAKDFFSSSSPWAAALEYQSVAALGSEGSPRPFSSIRA